MTGGSAPSRPFDPASLGRLDEPVRRYLTHAIAPGAPTGTSMRLTMAGRIDVGRWLDFTAEQRFTGHAFTWRARAGWGGFKPLHVVDRYADGEGSTEGRLLGRVPFLRGRGPDTTRSAAGRAAAESIWIPTTLLPGRGVRWEARSDTLVVAAFAVPPEHPEVELEIDGKGALRSIRMMRWGNVGREGFGPIPFGGHIHEEHRFGGLVLPSRVSVGWWFGAPRFKPFFEARVLTAEATVG